MDLPECRVQWRGWKEAGVVGDSEQERRAEAGLEAGASQCMKGALGKVRGCRLYPKSKGTQVERLQAGVAPSILVGLERSLWCSIEVSRRGQEWMLESHLGVHVKENGAPVWGGGRKKSIFVRCLGDSINRLR